MTDEHDPQLPPSSASEFRYDVEPYVAPGTFAAPRLLLGVVGLVLLAFILGWCAHWLDTWVPAIEWAWTLGLGFAMGLLGAAAVRGARLRHGGLAALCGLLAGALCLVAMHYWNYRDALPALADRTRAWAVEVVAFDLARKNPKPPVNPGAGRRPGAAKTQPPLAITDVVRPVIDEQLAAGKIDPAILPQAVAFLASGNKANLPDLGEPINAAVRNAVARFSFVGYLDWKAAQGVALALPKVRKPIELGHTGSIVYWVVELLIAGGIAAGLFYSTSQQPYCSNCDDWLIVRPLGRLRLIPDRARQVFREGALLDLAGEDLASETGTILLKVGSCPNCAEEGSITVQVYQLTRNDRDKEVEAQLTEPLVYPGTALPVLKALTTPAPPPEATAAEDAAPAP